MFVLGHVGIGRAIVGSRGRALPVAAFAIGAILPDIIDKPLYYAHLSSFISCTRTFGHTGLFALLLVTIAIFQSRRSPGPFRGSPGPFRRSPGPSGPGKRGPVWTALAVGAATHGLFDTVLDLLSGGESSTLVALAWPFLDTHFFTYPFKTPMDQLRNLWRAPVIVCELIGGALLWREFRPRR